MKKPATPSVLVSTGAIIGRANGFDPRLIPPAREVLDCDGFELMTLEPWYGIYEDVSRILKKENFVPRTVHLEKKIGILLAENTPESTAEAVRHLKENLALCREVGAHLAVLHLWGGAFSDYALPAAIEKLASFFSLAEEAETVLTIENIPCKAGTPLRAWEQIAAAFPDAPFTFDTRFGAFHGETADILQSPLWKNVRHMHISDYRGGLREWETLRPILHPGEGGQDFDALFEALPSYPAAMAVESPVLREDGTNDFDKLNKTVSYLRSLCKKHKKQSESV
ncbi:MAG: sugar phosphate isomerase/epimerase [Ruminococcus sp.]|nr:sugar phosphate isomerase/epimerase [Candidatus Apopatosoma intestinale]